MTGDGHTLQPTPRRLLLVTATWPPHRVAEADHAFQEAMHLARDGVEVHVLTLDREGLLRPNGIHVHVVQGWGWRYFPEVWKLLGRVRPQGTLLIFMASFYKYSKMVVVLSTIAKLRLRGSRFATQLPAAVKRFPENKRSRYGAPVDKIRNALFVHLGQFAWGTLLVHSDSLLVMSVPARRQMGELHAPLERKTIIVPSPPLMNVLPDTPENREIGRNRLGLQRDDFVFAFFGRLYPKKGIETLLRAFRRASEHDSRLRLAMVGGFSATDLHWQTEGYDETLLKLEADLNLGSLVVWTGEYDSESTDASYFLRAADVVVLPPDPGIHVHNSSLAAAAAHELPTIVTEPPDGFEAALVPGENVHAFRPYDEDALVEALLRLTRDADYRRRLAAGSGELALRWFTWDGCVAAIRNALEV
jgi:polysaccharide biosynthesis protein PslF